MPAKVNVTKESLEEMLGDGLTNRQIAKELGCHHNTVRVLLKEYDLQPARARGLPPDPVDELHSRCRKCNLVVANEDFPYVLNKVDGRRLSYCKKCRYRQYRESTLSSPERYWRERTNQIRKRCGEKGIPFALPEGYLYSLWVMQGGKCFYTDVAMDAVFDRGLRDTSASVDKIIISDGYVVGNVVLCTSRANSIKYDQTLEEMKQWMPSWYERLANRLDSHNGNIHDVWQDLPGVVNNALLQG